MPSRISTSLPPEVMRYFDAALDVAPDERQTWLADLSTTEPDIADAVRGLLTQLNELDSAGFLGGSALADRNVAYEIEFYVKCLRPGKWIGGHDYTDTPAEGDGVKAAVDRLLGVPPYRFSDGSWLVKIGEK